MLIISGEISSISLNSLLITFDGSILLVVWPGFLQTNVLFKKIIWMKDVMFAQWGCCLCLWQPGVGREQEGERHPKDDEGAAVNPRRRLAPGHGEYLPLRAWNQGSHGQAVTNPRKELWPEAGCPSPGGGAILLPSCHVHFLTMDTPVWVYTVETTSVAPSILWQVLELTQKETEDSIPFVPPWPLA